MIDLRPINTLKKTSTALGIYASLVGMQHGIFQILRTDVKHSGLLIYAIGPACDPELIWHSCFPALTLMPTYLVSGISAVLVSLYLLVWVIEFSEANHAARLTALFSLLLLPFGGGFVPVYTGLLASFSLALHNRPRQASTTPSLRTRRFFCHFWKPTLLVYLAWLPLSWVFGYFFNRLILSSGPLFFLFFDIFLPALILLCAHQCDMQAFKHEST